MFLQGKINDEIITDFDSWCLSTNSSKAPIMGVDRHRIMSDGEGVTTLVCLYECPLSCKYCLNPQCKEDYTSDRNINPSDLYQYVKKDDLYFQATGGGVTFGGGEPLCHPEFISAFHEICKDDGWNLRVETSLNVKRESVEEVLPFVHEFIVDIKDMNSTIYKAYTQMDNQLVKENLRFLVEQGAAEKVMVRIPSIKGYNTEDDIQKSKEELLKMGLTRFDCFTFETSLTEAQAKTVSGKSVCKILKDIRKSMADINDIEYEPAECHFEGNCPGTCPKCDEELMQLTEQLLIRKKNGTLQKISNQRMSPINSFIHKIFASNIGGLICDN